MLTKGEVQMSVINFGQSVTLQEFAKAIGTVGKEVTIIGQGEPGIGKSSMLDRKSTRLNSSHT